MAVTTWTAGQVLAAQDLNDTLASKLDLAGGKILQIVRATDSTLRSTTSTTYVDASISVTITPQKNDSAILILWCGVITGQSGTITNLTTYQRITDSSNNPISGAELGLNGTANLTGSGTIYAFNTFFLSAYATPATTSATTYKGRYQVESAGAQASIRNDVCTGQMYAIEVSA